MAAPLGEAKGKVEGSLAAVDAEGAGRTVGTGFATGLAAPITESGGKIEQGLKSVDAEAAGRDVGTRYAGAVSAPVGAAGGEVEKGLRAVDAEGAGRNVGGRYASEVGAQVGTAGSAVEKGLRSADAEGAGRAVGGRFTSALRAPFSQVSSMLTGALAIGGGVALFKGIMDQGGAALKATKVVTDAIKTTGGAANVTAGQIDQLAAAQGRATGVDKSAIEQSDALLLRFTGIKNAAGANNDVFNRTSQAALDMTAAMNKGTVTEQGLTQTSRLLGKALEDPSKAAGALRRSGVDLTAQQQDQIKTFLKSNDTLDAQKVVLDAVNKSYGGTAAATASGTAKMRESLNELEASVGKVLVPLFGQLIKAVTGFLAVIAPVTDWFGRGSAGARLIVDALIALVAVFAAWTAATKIASLATEAWATSQKIAESATKAYGTAIKLATGEQKLFTLATEESDAALLANPIGIIVLALIALGVAFYEAYKHSQAFRTIVQDTWGAIKAVAVPAAHALGDAVRVLVDLVKVLGQAFAVLAAPVVRVFGSMRDALTSFIGTWTTSNNIITGTFAATFNFLMFYASKLGPVFSVLTGPIVHTFDTMRDALTSFIGTWTTSGNIITGTFAATWNFLVFYTQKIAAVLWTPIRDAAAMFDRWWAGSGDQVKAVWTELWKVLADIFKIYWAIITTEVKIGWDIIRAVFEVGAAAVNVAWKLIATEIEAGWLVIEAVFKIGAAAIEAVWKIAWALLGVEFKIAWALITAALRVGWALIQALFRTGMAVITAAWRIGWAAMAAILKTEWALMTAVLKVAWAIFAGVITVGLDLLTGKWRKAWNDAANTLRTIWNAMTGFLRSTLGAWQGFFSAALDAIVGVWRTGWTSMSNVAKTAVDAITGVIKTLISILTHDIPAAFNAAVGAVASAMDRMKNAIVAPVDFITAKLGSIGKVFNTISGAVGATAKITGIPGLAGGGRITAGTTPTADDVLIRVSRDETVISAADTRRHAATLAEWGIPGFASGGAVGTIEAGAKSAAKATTTAAVNASDSAISATKAATGAVVGAAQDAFSQIVTVEGKAIDIGKLTDAMFSGDRAGIHTAFEHLLGEHHPDVTHDSQMDQVVIETPNKSADMLTDWLKDNGGIAGGSTILSYAMTFANKVPYVWGGAQPSGWDCSGFVSWIYMHYNLLHQRMVADALQSWGKPTAGPVPGGMVFFGKPAHHIGFAMDNTNYLSALGHKWGTIVSSVAGNSGFAIPPSGFDQVNGAAGSFGSSPVTWMNNGGVNQWAGTVARALAMLSLPQSLVPQVLHQIQTESGGNPNVKNNWDINAQHGDPSVGLLQVIGATFRAYHVPGTSMNILDPLANIAAAINYAQHRYGPSLMRGGMGLGSGHGYADGGRITEPVTGIGHISGDLYTFGERGTEWVIPEGGRAPVSLAPQPPASAAAAQAGYPGLAAAIDRLAAALDDHPARVAAGVAQALDGVARNSAVGAHWATR